MDNFFFYIKPNFLEKCEDILKIVRKKVDVIDIYFLNNINDFFIENIYGHYEWLWFYKKLFSYYRWKNIILIIVSWEFWIDYIKDIIWDKDPVKAKIWSIRNIFSADSLEKANYEKRIVDNVVHLQEDVEIMKKELAFIKKYLLAE